MYKTRQTSTFIYFLSNIISLSPCLLSPVYPHIRTSTRWNTWLIQDCCSASNIITLLPTLVSMETSFQSWLVADRCESAQTKKGRGGRGGGLFVFKHDYKNTQSSVVSRSQQWGDQSVQPFAYGHEKGPRIVWWGCLCVTSGGKRNHTVLFNFIIIHSILFELLDYEFDMAMIEFSSTLNVISHLPTHWLIDHELQWVDIVCLLFLARRVLIHDVE